VKRSWLTPNPTSRASDVSGIWVALLHALPTGGGAFPLPRRRFFDLLVNLDRATG
jgi:hypothetical protein